MRYIVYKMRKQVPETFFRFNIFLAANLAKPALYLGPAV